MKQILVGLTALVVFAVMIGCKQEPSSQRKVSGAGVSSKTPAAQSFVEAVPGTSVQIKPPPGFAKTDRFPGFINEVTGSSIVISEIPVTYSELASGFRDENRMQAKGMKLLNSSSVMADGHAAMLVHVEQSAYGTLYKKWILAVDRYSSTALIVASLPNAESEEQERLLKKSLLGVTFGKGTDPIEALAFTVKPEPPFEIAKVIGQNMTLSLGGEFPVKDENVPSMILGLSASKDLIVPNKKAFAEGRIMRTATVKNISVQQSTPVMIGHLSGYTTLAEGKDEGAATPVTIYQVLLFDPSGYCIIQGVTPSTKKEKYLPIFEKIAKSFTLKKPHNKAMDSDKK